MEIEISRHALNRLDERAYLKFFRSFSANRNQDEWLVDMAKKAIEENVKIPYLIYKPNTVALWHKGLCMIFKTFPERYILMTLYPYRRPEVSEISRA